MTGPLGLCAHVLVAGKGARGKKCFVLSPPRVSWSKLPKKNGGLGGAFIAAPSIGVWPVS